MSVSQTGEELTTGLDHRTRERFLEECFLRGDMRIETAGGEPVGLHKGVDANAAVAANLEEARCSGDQAIPRPLFVRGVIAHRRFLYYITIVIQCK